MKEWIFEYFWIAEIGVALCALLGLDFFLKRFFCQLKKKEGLKENRALVHLCEAAAFPAKALLWVFFLSFLADLGIRALDQEGAFSWIEPLKNVAIVFIVAGFFVRIKKLFYKSAVSQKIQGKLSVDLESLEIFGKGYTFGILFISLLALLRIFGMSIVPFLTFGGIGAAALGFASKDVVSNFFGGLMVYVTRPFAVRDVIELPEKKIMGQIEEIGWYRTSVRDSQKRAIYIPNSVFSTEILMNHSRITHRRIEESMGIRYADASKIQSLLEEIRKAFKTHPKVDLNLPVDVFLSSLAPHAFEIEMKGYVLSTQYEEFMEVKEQILLQIYGALQEKGAEIAPPSYGRF
jgi:MscS family membrane protein